MKNKLIFGSIVTSESPKGTLDMRNIINVIFTAIIGCLPSILNSLTVQLPQLEWGSYGGYLPIILAIIKVVGEMQAGKEM